MQELIIQKLNKIEQIVTNQVEKPLNLKEAAEYLGISKSTLYKMTGSSKKIKCYKPKGKLIYFNRVELNEWVYRSSQKSAVRSRQKTIRKQK